MPAIQSSPDPAPPRAAESVERLEWRCAIHKRRFLELARHRPEEVGQHPDGKRKGERQVGDDQRR